MGLNNVKEINKLVNDTTNETVNNILQTVSQTNSQNFNNIINQRASNINITAKGCKHVDLQKAKIKGDIKVVNSLSSKNVEDLKNDLTQKLTDTIKQKQKVKSELGGGWGLFSTTVQENDTENFVKNIIESSIDLDTINSNLTDINNIISQKLSTVNLNIDCTTNPTGEVTLQDANIGLQTQVKALSDAISSNILSNSLFSDVTNAIDQSQTVEQQGFASLIAKALLPLLAIFGILFLVFGGSVKALTNWKLWLVLVVLFSIYMLIAFFAKFWPFKQRFSPEINKNGLRTQNCIPDSKGAYDSKEKCFQDVNNPNSINYFDRFWGYNPYNEDGSQKKESDKDVVFCQQFPEYMTDVKCGNNTCTLYNTFRNKKECDNFANNRKRYTPKYNRNQSKDKFFGKFLGNLNDEDKKLFCNSNDYAFFDSCTEQILTPSELTPEKLENPPWNYFEDKGKCEESVKPENQTLVYFPKCTNSKSPYDGNCQYVRAKNPDDQIDRSYIPGPQDSMYQDKCTMCFTDGCEKE